MADKTAVQAEKYWRAQVADEIIKYADVTHVPHSKFTACPRCDIVAALRVVAKQVRHGSR
ncbi:MAG: hypothetical protein ACYCZR_15790 [Burkholderiales bacterium]